MTKQDTQLLVGKKWTVSATSTPLLLAAIALSSASPGSGVFVRFKLLDPTETSYYVRIGGTSTSSHGISRRRSSRPGPTVDGNKRARSGVFTEWFDLKQYGGIKLHSQLNRAGGVAEFPNITADFITNVNSPTRKILIELATAPYDRAVVKRFEESFTGSLTSFLVSPLLDADKDRLETELADDRTPARLGARGQWGQARVSDSAHRSNSLLGPSAARAEAARGRSAVVTFDRWPEVRQKYDFADPGGHHWVPGSRGRTSTIRSASRPRRPGPHHARRPSTSPTRSRRRRSTRTRPRVDIFTPGSRHRTSAPQNWE
jgi:hypothetical protein